MSEAIDWKTSGDLFQESVEALVNTVNTVGVMGKGVALQFKQRFPSNYTAYRKACERNEVRIGHMFITEVQELTAIEYIVNFPTKKDFRHNSKLEYVEAGLIDLTRVIRERGIQSVALPPLGAGLGRLKWEEVKPLMKKHLEPLAKAGVKVVVFEPNAAHQAPDRQKPAALNLTPWRVMLLEALRAYIDMNFGASLIELHKIAYLLHRLDPDPKNPHLFEAWNFGPYSHQVHHALNDLDEVWLTGMKNLTAKYLDPITLKADRLAEITQARQELLTPDLQKRLELAKDLMSGFESPYGLELLTTVDWVMKELPGGFRDAERVCEGVYQWPRKPEWKRQLMLPRDIGIAQSWLLEHSEALRYGS